MAFFNFEPIDWGAVVGVAFTIVGAVFAALSYFQSRKKTPPKMESIGVGNIQAGNDVNIGAAPSAPVAKLGERE